MRNNGLSPTMTRMACFAVVPRTVDLPGGVTVPLLVTDHHAGDLHTNLCPAHRATGETFVAQKVRLTAAFIYGILMFKQRDHAGQSTVAAGAIAL